MTGKEFIDRVDFLLKKQNQTRKLLTQELGIASSTMANWSTQNTTPNANVVEQIANYFNVSTDWLITGKEFNFEITPEEKEILSIFNSLPEEKKALAKNLLKTLQEG